MQSKINSWLESVYSDGSKYFVSNPTPRKGERFTITIRLYDDVPIKAVYIAAKMNGHLKTSKMKYAYTKRGLAYYEIDLKCFEMTFSYQFYICAQDGIYYYNQKGISTYELPEIYNFKILIDYEVPKWVKNAVFYQIFPDRFCIGDSANFVIDSEYQIDGFNTLHVKEWNSVPDIYEKTHCLDFYGGDLEGIRKKIPYLKKLGINAIYLNPIFCAASVHRYDTVDYFHVDPHLGGDNALEKLVKELHAYDIKIILDISINHTGASHCWFNQTGIFFDKNEGAFHNPTAKEREYYYFNQDNQYICWEGEKNLPILNFLSEKLRDVLYMEDNAVLRKWLKEPYNIDGWRFDCGDVVSCNNLVHMQHKIWGEIRKKIKEISNEKFIMAEHWSEAIEFLNGNEWDSSMNYYGFTRPFRRFLGDLDYYYYPHKKDIIETMQKQKLNAEEFVKIYNEYSAQMPFVIQQMMFQFLDSHDLPRLHTVHYINSEDCIGAVVVMFALPGTPSIYYGDELEIEGYGKTIWESCRFPMPWEKDTNEVKMYFIYKTLCDLRKKEIALIEGGIKFLYAEENAFSFARIADDEVIVVICSISESTIKLDIDLRQFGKTNLKINKDYLGNVLCYKVKQAILNIEIPAHKTYIFKLEEG